MANPPVDGSDFGIREMTGDQRNLVLAGDHMLPMKPFTLDGEQRLETTWYNGNPVGSTQVLGGKENETVLKGKWSDRFIQITAPVQVYVSGSVIKSLKDLAAIVDDMRLKGQKMEVTWAHLARRGYMRRFKQDWHTLHDLEWEIVFEWVSRADEDAQVAASRQADLQAIIKDGDDALDALNNAANPPSGRNLDFGALVAQPIAELGEANDKLDTLLTNVTQNVTRSVDGSRQAASLMNGIVTQCQVFVDTMVRTPGQFAVPGTDLAKPRSIADVKVGQYILVENQNRAMVSKARALAHKSARNQQILLRTVDNDVARVFYARDNMDLRDVSRRFYGTSDGWQQIRKFNGFSSSRLVAGQVVMVPRTYTPPEAGA
jgi:hypothetical protein